MSFRSNEEYLFFELADPAIDFSVARMRGEEGISTLFEFQVELLSEDGEITFEDVVGQACVITVMDDIHTEEKGAFTETVSQERFFHGIVSHFEIAEEGTRFTTYHAVVVPKIWVLHHRENSRIFQEMGVQDIVTALFDELGMVSEEYQWKCQKTYAPYEYCVQYRETEFNFMSRLLEQEGIFYYFEHNEDGHVIVFHDDSPTLEAIEEDDIPVITQQSGMVSNQHIYAIKHTRSLTPGKVTLRDYNFTKPTLNLESNKENADDSKERELYQHPGSFLDKARGDFLANVRLKSVNTYKECIRGKSNVNKLIPGFTFFLNDKKTDKDFLITRVEHVAIQSQAYQEGSSTNVGRYNNRFVGIPIDVPFAPPRVSRIPIVEGTQTAIITGPSGEEIYTDEHGRVKVQFHWDREGVADEKSSCWIRVSQMWAGSNYGGFMLPRVGQEVIVDFLEGNPDRPIITGRVHHGDNRAPYKLPDKKTISTLKTNSSVGGGGFNELRFDDAKDKEQIFIHAQKNQDVRTLNNYFEYVGNDRHKVVEKNQFVNIKEDANSNIEGDSKNNITGELHNTFKSNVIETFKAGHDIEISADRKIKIGGADHLKAQKDISVEAGMNYGIKAGIKVDIKAGATLNLEAPAGINLKVGGSFVSVTPGGIFIKGPMVMINSGGAAAAASPSKPSAPKGASEPEEAIIADEATAGKVEEVKSKAKPRKPSKYGPQAKALKHAAETGTPFCEECEAAKKEQEKNKASK